MDKSTLTSLRRPSKRPRRQIERFALRRIAREIDVIVVRLHRDDFVDVKPVPYPVKGLANGF
jgi:hypothetical protein